MNAQDFADYYTTDKVAVLQAAFSKVAPSPNWKTAIHATVDATIAELNDITEGIEFITGTPRASVQMTCKPTDVAGVYRWTVRATGYYASVGA